MRALAYISVLAVLAVSGCSDRRIPSIETPAPDEWVTKYSTPEALCVGVFNNPRRGLLGQVFGLWTIHPARINFNKRNVEWKSGDAWLPVPDETLVPAGDEENREMLRLYKETTTSQ